LGKIRVHADVLAIGLYLAESGEPDAIARKSRTGGFRDDAPAVAIADVVNVRSGHAEKPVDRLAYGNVTIY
jgi:hypothetical protein